MWFRIRYFHKLKENYTESPPSGLRLMFYIGLIFFIELRNALIAFTVHDLFNLCVD